MFEEYIEENLCKVFLKLKTWHFEISLIIIILLCHSFNFYTLGKTLKFNDELNKFLTVYPRQIYIISWKILVFHQYWNLLGILKTLTFSIILVKLKTVIIIKLLNMFYKDIITILNSKLDRPYWCVVQFQGKALYNYLELTINACCY